MNILRNLFQVTVLLSLVACGDGATSNVTSSVPAVTPQIPNATSKTLKSVAPENLIIGVAASDDYLTNTKNHDIVEQNFNQITAENAMKMKFLHPTENGFSFANADAYVSYAKTHNLSVHGHTLIWYSDYQLPDFMKTYSGGKTEFLAMLKNHVTTIVNHFKGQVQSWDVVNEAIDDNGGYRNSVFYQKTGTDYLDQAFRDARAADTTVDLFYNDYSMEQGGNKFQTMQAMLDGMLARQVPITGIGFQMHVMLDYPSVDTIRASFKAIADRGLKVKISELDVPLNNPYGYGFIYKSLTDPAAALQKKRYCEIIKTYLEAVPVNLRGGVTVWGVRDSESWIPSTPDWKGNADWPLLFDANGKTKPAFEGFQLALESKPCG